MKDHKTLAASHIAFTTLAHTMYYGTKKPTPITFKWMKRFLRVFSYDKNRRYI